MLRQFVLLVLGSCCRLVFSSRGPAFSPGLLTWLLLNQETLFAPSAYCATDRYTVMVVVGTGPPFTLVAVTVMG